VTSLVGLAGYGAAKTPQIMRERIPGAFTGLALAGESSWVQKLSPLFFACAYQWRQSRRRAPEWAEIGTNCLVQNTTT
jgi:hypothetical protein